MSSSLISDISSSRLLIFRFRLRSPFAPAFSPPLSSMFALLFFLPSYAFSSFRFWIPIENDPMYPPAGLLPCFIFFFRSNEAFRSGDPSFRGCSFFSSDGFCSGIIFLVRLFKEGEARLFTSFLSFSPKKPSTRIARD